MLGSALVSGPKFHDRVVAETRALLVDDSRMKRAGLDLFGISPAKSAGVDLPELQGSVRDLGLNPRTYFAGREPAMRISTNLLALGCQSGADATLETPIRARSKSTGSRSLRISPLSTPRFTSARIA